MFLSFMTLNLASAFLPLQHPVDVPEYSKRIGGFDSPRIYPGLVELVRPQTHTYGSSGTNTEPSYEAKTWRLGSADQFEYLMLSKSRPQTSQEQAIRWGLLFQNFYGFNPDQIVPSRLPPAPTSINWGVCHTHVGYYP